MSLTLYKTTRTANLVGPDIRTVTASQQHGQGRAYACSTHGSKPPPVATKPAPPTSWIMYKTASAYRLAGIRDVQKRTASPKQRKRPDFVFGTRVRPEATGETAFGAIVCEEESAGPDTRLRPDEHDISGHGGSVNGIESQPDADNHESLPSGDDRNGHADTDDDEEGVLNKYSKEEYDL
ncbi:hypothetical protein N656DRAFT_805609 [Canariomyces notabilis]|uniref:Uncharacterized protein n=1 Tax=Canariomyces notabilis TaxID=2074819 RepID=A0AAN6TEI7_9PEZI|nr:hypothetical protein N656DRAFT_805609 [Canariomyces arenarius]